MLRKAFAAFLHIAKLCAEIFFASIRSHHNHNASTHFLGLLQGYVKDPT
jgi:isocitrate lyase